MFTGIVQSVGSVRAVKIRGEDRRLQILVGGLDMRRVKRGDSIAVNGCCLTVVEKFPGAFAADVSQETLALTTLGALERGAPVNLERALTLASRLGGHLVIGHVDGVGVVSREETQARSVRLTIEAPAELARYFARKGSVCVDGVSLTVNAVRDRIFEVNIIPHTLANTIMRGYQIGCEVNLEVDLVARYLERLLPAYLTDSDSASNRRGPVPGI